MTFALSPDELAHFETEGWAGPFPLLPASAARPLAAELRACHALTRGYFYPDTLDAGRSYYREEHWFQSLHSLSPRVASLGQRAEIVDRVAQLLGDDLLLWAGICFLQDPNGVLHWHTDTEFDYVRGISLWVGIDNVSPETSLKIIPGSHRYAEDPEVWISERGESQQSLADDARILELLKDTHPEAEILRVPISDGEFMIFNGKLWHASDNPSGADRTAMGLRYSPPDQQIRIPLTYLRPLQWDAARPPCLLVRGEDRHGLNRLIEPPRDT